MLKQNINELFSKTYSLVFKESFLVVLVISLSINALLAYYLIFLQTTTLSDFLKYNVALYNWLSIALTLLIAFSFGITATLLCWQLCKQKTTNAADLGNLLLGVLFGAVSMGDPLSGAYAAELFGVKGGLAIFPFQGLEIKVVALALLIFAGIRTSQSIIKQSESPAPAQEESILDIKEGNLVFNLNKKTATPLIPGIVGIALLFLVAFTPALGEKADFYISFQKSVAPEDNPQNDSFEPSPSPSAGETGDSNSQTAGSQVDAAAIISQINPKEGYTINAVYGNIGPKLLEAGAIDFEEMKGLYEKAGQPLTEGQIKILTEGSSEKIKITPENSYFLLNFLWAAGLANKNKILDEGAMIQYGGRSKAGNFASTGGWTLGKKKAMDLYSNFDIMILTPDQQRILEDFADNAYRPCCSNPTSFPDCNHGMAMLALGEIMASQGATADEIFEAFKYVNSFWFPQTYFDIATYFKAKENKDWNQVSGRLIAGKDYSTPQGWQKVRQWLSSNGYLKEAPSSGGGCGV